MDTYVEPEDLSNQINDINPIPVYAGPYSIVYRGRWRGTYVAIKVLRVVDGCNLHTMRRKIKRERVVWAMLNHPNILPLFGCAEADERFQPLGAFISPWCHYGTASAFLFKYGEFLDQMKRIDLWIGVASGVQHLHEHDPCLIHGDLKPTNVLIDENWNPVLCDFGLAAIFMEADLTTTSPHAGTERYLSPELILDDHPRTSVESDIYALGCIGLEFIFSLRPYHHRQNPPQGVIIKDILRGVQPATRPPGLDNFTDVIWDVIERCLCRDPSYRPAAADVLFWINTIISSMNILLAA